jgi:hypothetical protein
VAQLSRAQASLAAAITAESEAFAELAKVASNPASDEATAKRNVAAATSSTVALFRARVSGLMQLAESGTSHTGTDHASNPPASTIPTAIATAIGQARLRSQAANQQQLAMGSPGRVGDLNSWNPATSIGSPLSTSLTAKIIQGRFDIPFASLLQNRPDAAPGTFKLEDKAPASTPQTKWNWQMWAIAFDRFASCMASQWEHLVPSLASYKSTIKLFHDRYRVSHPFGFLRYDEKFRSLTAHFYRMNGFHPEWGTKHQDTFDVVFTNCRVANCDCCNSSDHFIESCPKLKATSAAKPTAVPERAKAKGAQICNKFNEGGCTFPTCKYIHVCKKCGGNHGVVDCDQ